MARVPLEDITVMKKRLKWWTVGRKKIILVKVLNSRKYWVNGPTVWWLSKIKTVIMTAMPSRLDSIIL